MNTTQEPSVTPPDTPRAAKAAIKRDVVTGFVIGASMSLPGISGGTMAVILGIYKDLVHAVSEVFRETKRSLRFLLPFGFAVCVGIVLLGNVITALIHAFEAPMMFLFVGAIVGTIPAIFAEAKAKPVRLSDIICVIVGFVLLFLFSLVPKTLFEFGGDVSVLVKSAILFGGGLFVSIPLVLPGISFSQALLMLGLYGQLFTAVKELSFGFLLPFGFGLVVGAFAVAKIMKSALENAPRQTYMVIGGFVLASILELARPFMEGTLALPSGFTLAISIALLCAGLIGTFMLGKVTGRSGNEPA